MGQKLSSNENLKYPLFDNAAQEKIYKDVRSFRDISNPYSDEEQKKVYKYIKTLNFTPTLYNIDDILNSIKANWSKGLYTTTSFKIISEKDKKMLKNKGFDVDEITSKSRPGLYSYNITWHPVTNLTKYTLFTSEELCELSKC